MDWDWYEGSREREGRCGAACAGLRAMSRDCRAGVERPERDVVMDGWRLRFPWPRVAAAARSAEACDCPLMGTLAVLLAWGWVEVFIMPLPVAETDVDGVFGTLLALRELEDR